MAMCLDVKTMLYVCAYIYTSIHINTFAFCCKCLSVFMVKHEGHSLSSNLFLRELIHDWRITIVITQTALNNQCVGIGN